MKPPASSLHNEATYAVLDTDFISKAISIRNGMHILADEILSFPGYAFYCHEKVRGELHGKGTDEAAEWLRQMTESGTISLYSDERIIRELEFCSLRSPISYFLSFLEKGCSYLISADFYENHFADLAGISEGNPLSFLSALHSCESTIGTGESYGEVKAFILARTLQLKTNYSVCVFCSDDSGARRGFSTMGNIPSISIPGVFVKMKSIGKTIEEMQPYFDDYIELCITKTNPVPMIKVWEYMFGTYKRVSVPMTFLLEDIYRGRYITGRNGDLQSSLSHD